jgi:hypothetical protein
MGRSQSCTTRAVVGTPFAEPDCLEMVNLERLRIRHIPQDGTGMGPDSSLALGEQIWFHVTEYHDH